MSSERRFVRRPCILADLLFSRGAWALAASLLAAACGQGTDGGSSAAGTGGKGGTETSGTTAGSGGSVGPSGGGHAGTDSIGTSGGAGSEGTAGSGGAGGSGGLAGSGGGAGAGGAGSACMTAGTELCDDFETGQLDAKKWKTNKPTASASITLDGQHVHSGQFAVHIKFVAGQQSTAMITENVTFPAASNSFYTRMFAYFSPEIPAAPTGDFHTGFIIGTG